MENVVIFNGYQENISAIWYILWPFGNLVVIWYIYIVDNSKKACLAAPLVDEHADQAVAVEAATAPLAFAAAADLTGAP
jgi:hypothetical protein